MVSNIEFSVRAWPCHAMLVCTNMWDLLSGEGQLTIIPSAHVELNLVLTSLISNSGNGEIMY